MKNTFLEAVSHDLRTPLTSILGSALTLERSKLSPRTTPSTWSTDRRQRAQARTPALRPPGPGPAPARDRLPQATRDRHRGVRPAGDRGDGHAGPEIEVDVRPRAPRSTSEDGAILENLLSNSLRHTPDRAKIWVHAAPKDGGLSLVVEDDGPGVPPELREAIFEPFRQDAGSSSEHAPGVGPVLPRPALRGAARGMAWAEERAGGGASFHVFLPGA